ncbi:hypothetical protein HNY73_018144 [Argiope bruennichi]|uniref:EGF-like domain-containing protein n=1 Tax=Argiope bruennichi TaxID=94029 RepID=A0A8T0EDB5_ARGBR|nr:hypothetical protein HNY73_018144 [Argiope bruennichi]
MIVGIKGKIVLLILTVGAVYFICEDLRERFNSSSQVPENAHPTLNVRKELFVGEYETNDGEELYIGRKLLAHDPNVNKKSLELESDKNLNKAKFNEENLQEISKNFISYKNIGRNRMKKLSRRKRNTHHTDFGWRLSLNVTNNKSPPKGVSNFESKDDLISKSGKEKFLNIAVQMEAASPDDNSFKELHQAWDSLGLLLRRLYGKNASFKENARDITIETTTEQDDNIKTEIPTEKPERERSPKFLFGLINFGSTENPPLEEVGTIPGINNSSESVTSSKENVGLQEELISTEIFLSLNSSEAPMEVNSSDHLFGLQEQISVDSTVVPISDTFIGLENTSPDLDSQSIEKFERTSADPDNDFPIEITTLKPEPSFTSEQLKEFCISLLSRIQVSPKSIDQFSEENGSGELDMVSMEDKEIMTEFQTLSTDVPKESTTKSTNQRFGIWASIWNRFVGRRLIQHSIDASLQSPTLTPKHDITLEKAKDGINDAFHSKVESSTVLGVSDSTESDQDFFNDEDGSALTVPDCENFFRQMQNDAVFSKPNLLDIINNPILLSLDPSQFNFTEVIDDKQERSMRSGSESKDSNFENILTTKDMAEGLNTPFSVAKSTGKELPDEFSVNDLLSEHPDKKNFEITVSNEDLLPTLNDNQESFQSGTFDKFNIDNLITENSNDFNKAATEISIFSDEFPEKQMQPFTEILDDGIFIQFDNHMRTDKPSEVPSSEVSADIDDRIFGLFNFGSGERSIDDSDSLSTQNASEFPEDPALISFTSSDSDLNEAFSVEGLGTTSSDSVTRRNIFDIILNLRKEESLIKSTDSVAFDINEGTQSMEDANTVLSAKKSQIESQFNSHEKRTENQEPSNMPATQSISDQMPLQNIPDEKLQTDSEFDPEEQFNESQNGALDSTISATKSLLENQTSFQVVLDDGSGDEGSRIIPGLFNIFGSGDGRELSESPFDPELNSESSECLDCFKNTSSSLSFDDYDYDDCGSDINDTVPLMGEKITTMNPLSDNIVSDAYVEDDGIYLDNKVNPLSESNQEPPQFSTDHFLKSIVSTPVAESVYYGHHDNSENNGYEVTNYDNSENNGYEVTNYENNGMKSPTMINSENNGYEVTNYDNSENNGYEVTNYDNSENNGYEVTNYDNSENNGYEVTDYDNSENNGYEVTDYDNSENNVANYDNSENNGYEVANYDTSENNGYDFPNYNNYENNGSDITTFQPLEHIHIEEECDEDHSDIEAQAFSASPTEAITSPEENFRFMDTLFLTGSGAGGLFGNDDGEINLVQEPDTTSFPSLLSPVSPRQSRRGGRKDDVSFVTWPTEKQDQVSEKQFDFTQSSSASENPKLDFHDTTINEKTLQPPEGEKKVDSVSNLDSFESIRSVEDGFESTKVDDGRTQIFHEPSSETFTAISSVVSSAIIPKKKAKDLPPRYCNNAGECNIALNEGCITKEGRSVCDCRRSFVRHPETDICEAPFMMRTSLKLPGEDFHEDLRDKYSDMYKNKTRDAIDTMWLVVYHDPTLEYNVADIDVAGFEKGSLVIHWEITFAVKKNESILEVVQELDEKLEETFKHKNVLNSAPLNVENAKLLSFSDINSCEKKELNYCSPNADCIRDGFRGFRCRCKEGYLDNSKNPMYPGEICIVTCPLDYCGENGYCEARSNGEKQCLCNGWYFGEKCDISGILVVSCFAGANVILIIIVLAAVFLVKRRRQRRTRFYENNQIRFQPNQELGPFGRVSPRLAASIALDEIGPTKTSKYMAISTPLYMKPDIQITSPSIMGSSISYDYDSTFDRTPSAEVNMEPPKYDSVPEVPKYDSVPQV